LTDCQVTLRTGPLGRGFLVHDLGGCAVEPDNRAADRMQRGKTETIGDPDDLLQAVREARREAKRQLGLLKQDTADYQALHRFVAACDDLVVSVALDRDSAV
jgi:hypothetical protein